MITGGTMLSSRFWHMDHAVFARIVLIHKGFALFWVLGMPLVLALRPRVHWLHLGAMLRWGRADILWMVQSIRSLYNKKAVIAPAGRFNTGQKVNACLVFLYFVGFVCTGACMTFQGAILIPWYIHTALFFASLSSVGGHLYLSLFNPGTRAALPGIFHGWSPMEYIEHHHPLSLPRPHQSHIPPASLRTTLEEIAESKVELAMILATLAMAGIGVWAFNRGRMTSAKLHFASTFASLISPSQLTTQHRLAPGGDSCTLCHSYMGGIPNRHCEKCHVVIAEHRAHQVGYHGTLKGDCIQCHKEHPDGTNSIVPLVRATFDHTLTGYPIEGRHVRLDCDECHRKKRTPAMPGVYFIGLKHDTCGDCHRDPHARPFAADCDRCHSVAGWTGTDLKFRHDTDTTYPLAGRHQTVECIACHKPPTRSDPLAGATFRGLSRDCTACHADPHRQQFAAVCTSCHSPAGWHGQALTFDHGRDSKFPLIGKHATLACAKCHQPADRQPLAAAQFAGLRSGCADCHTDPHQGQLAQACTACHSTAGWAQARLAFNHNRDSRFLLAAKHAAVACEKCHTPTTPGAPLAKARFRGLPAECADCHQDPHRGQFARTCVRCHPSPDGWRLDPLRFDHRRDTSFALTGRHNGVQCDRCHQPTPADGRLASAQFKDLGTACDGCHRTTHPQAYGGACISCHTPALWIKKDPGISHILKHKASGEELNGKHLTATCRECHTPARLAILGQAGQPGFACLTCHKPDDPHKGTLDDNCVKCHGVDGWKDESLRFNHDTMAAFALDDDHRKLACARCHENGHWKPLDSKCVSCHPKFFDRKKT
jgi:cytochrome b subunit of formate dehydrogenase